MKSDFTIGKALRPRGLKGEMRFELYTSDPSRFNSLRTAKLGGIPFEIEKVSAERDFAYFKFVGIDTAEEAEKHRGQTLVVDRAELPPPKEGTHYIADLIGLDVIVDGERIGELVDVLQYGTADVYMVKLIGEGSVNFPALKEVIRSIDIEKGEIVLDGYFFNRVAVFN